MELGKWLPAKGLTLATTPSDFPMWSGSVLVKLNGTISRGSTNIIEYKFVIVRESDG